MTSQDGKVTSSTGDFDTFPIRADHPSHSRSTLIARLEKSECAFCPICITNSIPSIEIGTYNTKSEHLDDRLTIRAHESRSNTASDKHIVLDKTFFYFVLDSINGLVLTMGRVRE